MSDRQRRAGAATSTLSTLVLSALLLLCAAAGPAVAADEPDCPSDAPHREVEVGIVKAVGCFATVSGEGETAVYNAQGEVDLNGFIVVPTGPGLSIDMKTHRVWGTGNGPGRSTVQLKSRNWPFAGTDTQIGQPFALDFVAPPSGSLVIEDIRLGIGSIPAQALAGLNPFFDVDTPIRIEEEGKGSMDLTVALTGYFALKDKPQAVTIKLPTESGKGTHLDGFSFALKEVDALKFFKIVDLEAEYSAAEKKLGAKASFLFPWTANKEQGFAGEFEIAEGRMAKIGIGAHGLSIPIGTPPGGFVTDIGGSIDFDYGAKGLNAFHMAADLGADFGPELPTPWGKVAPIGAKAALKLGADGQGFLFRLDGGLTIFRLPVGSAYLALHGNAGVEFGAGLGLGFPSYRDNPNDPFYIGAHVDGWVGKGRFQFSGDGRVALAGAKIFDGSVLVNDRVVGACWRVLGFPGGAVYRYGDTEVKTFGIACGLDAYREQLPRAATVAAGTARTIRLDSDEIVLEVTGRGGPPRFTLTHADGRAIAVPRAGVGDSVVADRHAAFVNTTGTNKTHVFIRAPRGRWTVSPHAGSPTIVSVRAGRRQPPERVVAEVRGRGPWRTLVWRSRGLANTRLVFTERLRNGPEMPILHTDRARGRHRFKVAGGSHYGVRRLHVTVLHGGTPRQAKVVDSFRVAPPRRLAPPARVTAERNVHDVRVAWRAARGARGYLVEVRRPRGGDRRPVSYVRRLGRGARSVVFRHTPGGGAYVARVHTLNRDGRLGPARAARFAANPPSRTLGVASRRSARSARVAGRTVRYRTQCPAGGHCQVRVQLRRGSRTVATTRFQQAPDTFQRGSLRAARRIGARSGLRLVVSVRRAVGPAATAIAPLR